MGQGGAAADGEPQASAERGMNLAKNDRAEVEARVGVEAAIQIAQIVEGGVEEWTARFDLIDDAPMDRFPHRGHADQRRRAHVGERARQRFRIDFERINDRRAARERQQHPAGELERMMQRQAATARRRRRRATKTRESIATSAAKFPCDSITPFGAPVLPEVKTIDASAFRSGGAGGVFAAPRRMNGRASSARSSSISFGCASPSAEPRRLCNRARAQRRRRLRDLADRRELFGGDQMIERHRDRAGA